MAVLTTKPALLDSISLRSLPSRLGSSIAARCCCLTGFNAPAKSLAGLRRRTLDRLLAAPCALCQSFHGLQPALIPLAVLVQ